MKKFTLAFVAVAAAVAMCFSVVANAENFEYHGRTEGVITAYATGRVGNNFIRLDKTTTIEYIDNLDEYLSIIQKSFKNKSVVEIVISGKVSETLPIIHIESMVVLR